MHLRGQISLKSAKIRPEMEYWLQNRSAPRLLGFTCTESLKVYLNAQLSEIALCKGIVKWSNTQDFTAFQSVQDIKQTPCI